MSLAERSGTCELHSGHGRPTAGGCWVSADVESLERIAITLLREESVECHPNPRTEPTPGVPRATGLAGPAS
jgi:hypothetical protein